MDENLKNPNNGFALQGDTRLKKDVTTHLRRYEGARNKIYLDSKNIPTISIGIALGEVKDGKVVLYSFDQINKILASGGSTARLSQRDYQRLLDAIEFPKNNLRGQRKLERKNPLEEISLTLTDNQVNQIFEGELKKRLTKLEIASNEHQIDLVMDVPYEIKLIMVDLFWRGGHKLLYGKTKKGDDFQSTKYLKEKNYGGFLAEVFYNSNGDNLGNNDARHLVLVEKALESTPAELKKERLQEIQDWRQMHPEQVRKTIDRITQQNNNERKNKNIPPLDPEFLEKQLKAGGMSAGLVSVRGHINDGHPVNPYQRNYPNR